MLNEYKTMTDDGYKGVHKHSMYNYFNSYWSSHVIIAHVVKWYHISDCQTKQQPSAKAANQSNKKACHYTNQGTSKNGLILCIIIEVPLWIAERHKDD